MEEQKITRDIKAFSEKDILKKHFSNFFNKNGEFDFKKFEKYLSENEVNFSSESYGLEWLGKSYARLIATDPATTLLKADENHNNKTENANSENLLIKGDNLEVCTFN
jgi:adenine-specific DNA-methyltransferase